MYNINTHMYNKTANKCSASSLDNLQKEIEKQKMYNINVKKEKLKTLLKSIKLIEYVHCKKKKGILDET